MSEWISLPVRLFWRFLDNHGIALASNIAFSLLLSLFPFLLLVTGFTILAGGDQLGPVVQHALSILLPDAIADILQPEVDAVVSASSGRLLSVSALIFLVTLTGAVESLREGLNRAYGYYERRSIWSRRAGGLIAILGAGLVLVAVSAGLFFAPVIWNLALPHAPWLENFEFTFDIVRLGIALPMLLAFLVASHRWLPMRVIEWRDLWPGVVVTLVLWYLAGQGYNYYLSHFASYSRVYAGLAGVVTTLIFLHIISSIFLIGAEVNAIRMRLRRVKQNKISRAELEHPGSTG